jgi:hypothetical protein
MRYYDGKSPALSYYIFNGITLLFFKLWIQQNAVVANMKKTTMIVVSVFVLIILIIIGIGCAIYCRYKKKNKGAFGLVSTSESGSSSKRIVKKGTSQQAVASSYPEQSAAP